MIKERMIELLLLLNLTSELEITGLEDSFKFSKNKYDANKFIARMISLAEEFLEPYVIESDSKE